MRTYFGLLIASSLLAAPAYGQCSHVLAPGREHVDAANSAVFSAAWLSALERLAAAIPTLSPDEEIWLEKRMSGDPSRAVRDMVRRKYILQKVRQNAQGLAAIMRQITHEQDQKALVENWIMFVSTLLEQDSAYYLARLIAEQIVRREAVPDLWVMLMKDNADYEMIRDQVVCGRTTLAQNVLDCTLPPLIGVQRPKAQ